MLAPTKFHQSSAERRRRVVDCRVDLPSRHLHLTHRSSIELKKKPIFEMRYLVLIYFTDGMLNKTYVVNKVLTDLLKWIEIHAPRNKSRRPPMSQDV